MGKIGLVYHPATGDVIGSVYCSQDEDLALQEAPHVEVPPDHPAIRDPKGWAIRDEAGKKVPREKDKERP